MPKGRPASQHRDGDREPDFPRSDPSTCSVALIASWPDLTGSSAGRTGASAANRNAHAGREGRFFGQRTESKQVNKKDFTTENAEGHGGPRRKIMALRAIFDHRSVRIDHTSARSAQKSLLLRASSVVLRVLRGKGFPCRTSSTVVPPRRLSSRRQIRAGAVSDRDATHSRHGLARLGRWSRIGPDGATVRFSSTLSGMSPNTCRTGLRSKHLTGPSPSTR
jgi:hypothetical protein